MLPIIKPGIRGENKKSDQMEWTGGIRITVNISLVDE